MVPDGADALAPGMRPGQPHGAVERVRSIRQETDAIRPSYGILANDFKQQAGRIVLPCTSDTAWAEGNMLQRQPMLCRQRVALAGVAQHRAALIEYPGDLLLMYAMRRSPSLTAWPTPHHVYIAPLRRDRAARPRLRRRAAGE